MPYVPYADRTKIDPAVETLAHEVARTVTVNLSLVPVYHHSLVAIANVLKKAITPKFVVDEPPNHEAAKNLGRAILDAAVANGAPADGYCLGPLNYATTRLIQRVPQIKVERGDWSEEMRYWMHPAMIEALHLAARDTLDYGIGVAGVFLDVVAEYKGRANAAYEVAQAIKNGDCFDTPYYSKPVPLHNVHGRRLGHVMATFQRSGTTLDAREAPFRLLIVDESTSDD